MLRLLQWCLLGSIALYAAVSGIGSPSGQAVNPTISYLFSMLAVATVGAIFVVRRTLVLRAAESLITHPDDVISLGHWKTGFIATYALCEALALFGLILRFLGCTFQQCVLFYIGGFVLLFFFRPKEPAVAAGTSMSS
jgi:hypothetical protein